MDIAGTHIDLSGIVGVVLSLVAALIGLAASKVRAASEASAAKSKTESAMLKVAALATSLAGRAWDKLSPQLQLALADGAISATERADIERSVKELLADFTSSDDLEKLAVALGLPMPLLIGKIASMLIGMFTSAHDVTNTATSALQYPLKEADERDPFVAAKNDAG